MTISILHGDCLDVMNGLEASFDALVCDPPFGLGKIYAGKREEADGSERYWEWLEPRYKKALSLVKPGGFVAMWQPQPYMRHFWDWYGDSIHIYAACKNFVQLRKKIPINYGYDPVVMFYKDGEPLRPIPAKRNLDFFVANTASMVSNPNRIERRHPFPRPIDQVEQIVSNFVIPGGSVLDPFAGSGTTIVACHRNGRSATGIDSEIEYVNLMKERLAAEPPTTG